MFDYHLHSKLSFDSTCEPCRIVAAAERQGLKEICFTDHYDFNDVFEMEEYESVMIEQLDATNPEVGYN